MKKKYIQKCVMDKAGPPEMKKVFFAKGIGDKRVTEIYSKYYRDQVAALYKAVIVGK
ncbi:MAG: hypothetical protein HQL30_00810 [Candidatus Omnitrophica bacterium]|nr:hypothetical protein [Candidatus Omnitrophota bacterium]